MGTTEKHQAIRDEIDEARAEGDLSRVGWAALELAYREARFCRSDLERLKVQGASAARIADAERALASAEDTLIRVGDRYRSARVDGIISEDRRQSGIPGGLFGEK